MGPVLVNVSVAGCRPFPALQCDGKALALAWWQGTVLGGFDRFDQLLEAWPLAERALRAGTDDEMGRVVAAHGAPLHSLSVHAPIAPRQVYCTIGNYRSQVVEAAVDGGDGPGGAGASARRDAALSALALRRREGVPYICMKPVASIAHPFADLPLAPDVSTLDWEVEIGVVIGRPAWRVQPAQALDHVAGYCVVNDLTVRERVFRSDPPMLGTDWVQSKGGPGLLPVGPWLVPAWQVADHTALRPWLRLNGQLMQSGRADDMLFGVAEQIAYLSHHVRLQAGDLLCTGSPAGFGAHHGRHLRPGDVLEVGVDGLGTQRTTCIEPSNH